VSEAARQRRELLRRLADAHDEERHRIVGELHDSLAADLIRVLYGIRGIAARSATLPREIATEITGLETLVQQTETRLRALMGRVQPAAISAGGFDDALESLASRARTEAGLEVRVRNRGAGTGLSDDAQQALIRAVDEALMNVRKHAQAQRVLIRTSADASRFRLSIDDDGVGWGDRVALTDGRGLGLAYVEERVAAIGGNVIRSSSRLGGARLLLVVPRASRP
jgi:signal transduction histidine kinase